MKISDILNIKPITESRTYVSGRDFTIVPGTKFHGYVMGDESISDEDSRKAMYGVYKYVKDTTYSSGGTQYTQKHYERICGLVGKKTGASPTPYGADYKKIYRSTVMKLISGDKKPEIDATGEELNEVWPFKKKNDTLIYEPSKYPKSNDDLVKWMHDKIEYYVSKGYDPAKFFSPTCAEYFPLLIQVGGSYSGAAVAAYKEIKKEYPKLVARAKEKYTTPIDANIKRKLVGDPEDFILPPGQSFGNINEYAGAMPSQSEHDARVNNITKNLAAQGHKVVNQTHDNSADGSHKTTIEYTPKKTGFFSKQQPNKTVSINTTKSTYVPPVPQKIVGASERREFRGLNKPK